MTMPSVSEEMIQALRQIRELNMSGADENGHQWANSDLIDQEVTAALSLLAHLPAGSEAVKPLEWVKDNMWNCFAKSAFGQYKIAKLNVPGILPGAVWYAPDGGKNDADSIEEAKAAAQADFARRVLSCLAPSSTPPAANVQEELAGLKEEITYLLTGGDPATSAQQRLDWIKFVLSRSKQAPTVVVPDEAVTGRAIFGEGPQARVYDLFRANPSTRGDHADFYKRGIAGIMRPHRESTAYAAWLAGTHDRARAEQRETPSGVVGEGWKLVPVEPTPEMYAAVIAEKRSVVAAAKIWPLMIAAAPTSDGR